VISPNPRAGKGDSRQISPPRRFTDPLWAFDPSFVHPLPDSHTLPPWVKCMDKVLIETAKLVTRAKRMGDSNLHVSAVTRMLSRCSYWPQPLGKVRSSACWCWSCRALMHGYSTSLLPTGFTLLGDQTASGRSLDRPRDWTNYDAGNKRSRRNNSRCAMTEFVCLTCGYKACTCYFASVHQTMTCLTGLESPSSEQDVPCSLPVTTGWLLGPPY
jgi:hypothetical protein